MIKVYFGKDMVWKMDVFKAFLTFLIIAIIKR